MRKNMTYELGDVFVPAGFPRYTFIEREHLKISIMSSKLNKSRHVNIFGTSKSGKSNLWRKYFELKKIIKIGINSNTTINDIYQEILSELEVFYSSETSSQNSVQSSIISEIKAKIQLIAEAKAQFAIKATRNIGEKQERLVAPLISANTICRYLKESEKYIVIEDFHYANELLCQQLAQDFKTFSDESCKFILVSIKHMTPILYKLNDKELQGRIVDIPVGLFENEELEEIINLGTDKLNIQFSKEIKNAIIHESKKSAAITQDICQRICLLADIKNTTKEKIQISNMMYLDKACKMIANEQRSVYEKIIDAIRTHSHGNNKKDTYIWLMKYIQSNEIPNEGVSHNTVFRKIKEMGHETILLPSITNGLKYLPKLMEKNDLGIFFSYNEKNNLFKIEDSYLQFVFKWLPDMVESLIG